MNAQQLRERIVTRLEAFNAANDVPDYWRVRNGVVQRGVLACFLCNGLNGIQWQTIPMLSLVLLAEYRDARERQEQGIPY